MALPHERVTLGTSPALPHIAYAGAIIVVLLLAALHVLSPEFDPSWRVVSEYANGHYGWLLSLMFACWAISSWALGFALLTHVESRIGKAGAWLLIVTGIGEALAALFDINQPLHGLAGLLGSGLFPAAAICTSIAVRREGLLSRGGSVTMLARTAWCSLLVLLLMIGSVIILFETYTRAGGHIPPDGKSLPLGTTLPHGAIALVGYANRLLVLVNCAWLTIAARMLMGNESSRGYATATPHEG